MIEKIKGMLPTLGVAAFIATMISSAGIAVFPSIGRPVIKIVWGSAKSTSHNYSYKPGQRGVERRFYYLDKRGRPRQINTLLVVLANIVFYTPMVFLALLAWSLFQRKNKNS